VMTTLLAAVSAIMLRRGAVAVVDEWKVFVGGRRRRWGGRCDVIFVLDDAAAATDDAAGCFFAAHRCGVMSILRR